MQVSINATGYAADHRHDGTLADAIEANYDGSCCIRNCDDPEHSHVVEEVLGWIAPLA